MSSAASTPGQDNDGLVVLITGGGSGIGRATARELLNRGHRVVVCGRRPEPLSETLVAHAGGLALQLDVSDPDQVTSVFDEVATRFGRLDVLFNNAGGGGSGGAVDEVGYEDWQQVVAVNLTGSMLCAAAAVRLMKRQQPGGGRIINNGSVSAHAPRPNSVAYTATKHAISGLTKSIELDGRPWRIRGNQIDIGSAAAGMMGGSPQASLQPNGDKLVEATLDVAEVARTLTFIAELPLAASVNSLLITAGGMPFVGRG